MPRTCIDTADAVELAELLEFIARWLATDPATLAPSFCTYIGHPAYGLNELRADLNRFTFLLGGNDGEFLFGEDRPDHWSSRPDCVSRDAQLIPSPANPARLSGLPVKSPIPAIAPDSWGAGSMTAEDGSQDTPDEHERFTAYLQALSQVPDDAELALVAEVLTDPDVVMAQSAVCRHLDRRAGTLLPGPDYMPWAQAMAGVVASRPFLAERLHEWSLFRAVTLSQSWSPDALTGASNWLQLKVATGPGTTEAAAILAEAGRTKRIRNAARAAVTGKNRN